MLVQAEVAERLAAAPGSPAYGVPSVKAAWYGEVRRAGAVGRRVFWPEPNVDSGLVALTRRPPPPGDRVATFAVVDAAFANRRKSLRAALARWAGNPATAEARLRAAGIDPAARGEELSVAEFARAAAADGADGAARPRMGHRERSAPVARDVSEAVGHRPRPGQDQCATGPWGRCAPTAITTSSTVFLAVSLFDTVTVRPGRGAVPDRVR